MNHLLRQIAPISESVWALLDQEARQRLGATLGARKLVDYGGPYGWHFSATNVGEVKPLAVEPADGVTGLREGHQRLSRRYCRGARAVGHRCRSSC